nr:hypothetical protein [Tanacetum cinerariifolium]
MHREQKQPQRNFKAKSLVNKAQGVIYELTRGINRSIELQIDGRDQMGQKSSRLGLGDSEDSLIMENEDLNTFPEKESDEFKKSSVEDIVPIPSESEDTSGSYSKCIFPSDNESLSDEEVPKDNVKIYSNPLFEFDDEYISSDVNPPFDEVLDNIESKDSYDSNFDEPYLLVTPLSDVNEDECFYPGGDTNEIDAFLDINTSMDINDGYYDSKGDVIYLESLLTNDTIPSLPSEVFLDHDLKSLKD